MYNSNRPLASSDTGQTPTVLAAMGQWQSNALVSNPEAQLEQRWISIPQNVWHRPVVGADADWTVVSFHTVPAGELIEEKPDDSSRDGTKQMKYLAREARK